MPKPLKERITEIFKRKPKMKIKKVTVDRDYEFWAHNFKIKSFSDQRRWVNEVDSQIGKLYKKKPNARIKMTSWIFATHPNLAERYGIEYDKVEQAKFNKTFRKEIKQVLSFKQDNRGSIFTVITKAGEKKDMQFWNMPSFFLDFTEPKTIEVLRKNKIIP